MQRTRSTRSDGAARRELLLEAAIRVIAEHGAAALTHRSAAAAAGVPVASASYHFPSIDEFRLECYQRSGERLELALAEVVEYTEQNPEEIPERFGEFVDSLVSEHRVDMVTVVEMYAAAIHDARLRPVIESFAALTAELLGRYLGSAEQGRAIGEAAGGMALTRLAIGGNPDELAATVADMVRRARG